MNLQSGGDRLHRHMLIKSSFYYLGKCARPAKLSGALELERNSILGKRGPLQQLCAAR